MNHWWLWPIIAIGFVVLVWVGWWISGLIVKDLIKPSPKPYTVWEPSNVYESAKIGKDVSIGMFSEIGHNVEIGDGTRIGAMAFIPEGFTIGKGCFVGPKFCGSNDKFPMSKKEDWKKTVIEDGASVGAAVVILPGITIGKNSLVGAGSVVTTSIPPNEIWCGNPARFLRLRNDPKTDDNISSFVAERVKPSADAVKPYSGFRNK